MVNKAYFPLKFWITNHSKLPSFGYADGHISSRTLAKWIPEEPAYKVANPEFFVHLFRKRSYSDSGSARTPSSPAIGGVPVISRTLLRYCPE